MNNEYVGPCMGLFTYEREKKVFFLRIMKDSREFQTVFTSGKWFGGEYIVIYVYKNNKNCNRIGIAVGKKIAKSVYRNRMRRVIKEAYRFTENRLKIGFDIVIAAKSSTNIKLIHMNDIQTDLVKCFKKADILLENNPLAFEEKNQKEEESSC